MNREQIYEDIKTIYRLASVGDTAMAEGYDAAPFLDTLPEKAREAWKRLKAEFEEPKKAPLLPGKVEGWKVSRGPNFHQFRRENWFGTLGRYSGRVALYLHNRGVDESEIEVGNDENMIAVAAQWFTSAAEKHFNQAEQDYRKGAL